MLVNMLGKASFDRRASYFGAEILKDFILGTGAPLLVIYRE